MDPKLRWDGDKNIGHVAISVGHNPGTRQELGPWTASFSSTADVGGGPVNFVDPVHG